MKGYKVSDASRNKICGLASSSLAELKSKAVKKLQVDDPSKYFFILLDGTIVDNEAYFQTIPSQTFLILAREDQQVSTGADIIYNALRAVNIDYLRAGENIKLFFDEHIKEKLRVLSDELAKCEGAESKTALSSRIDHGEWFEGLDTNCTTKEDFLKRRCKDRINGYYYKACSDLKKSCKNSEEREVIEHVLVKLKKKLSLDNCNGGYFDRRDKRKLCDSFGEFTCRGVWNKERCLYAEIRSHVINPYRSREDRILFSTWNLDHRIEKSRTIIPCILEALRSIILKKCNSYDFNYDLIYSLLFTCENLRLVHIVCHDKGAHECVLEAEDLVMPLSSGVKKSQLSLRGEEVGARPVH